MRTAVLALSSLVATCVGQPSLPQFPNTGTSPQQWRGVVVEEVDQGSALEAAGIKPGDLLLSWKRLPNPPANPEGASGKIDSIFDWKWLATEQAPRGIVELMIQRAGNLQAFSIPVGSWMSEVRPALPTGTLSEYLEVRQQIAAGNLNETTEALQNLKTDAEKTIDWRVRRDLFFRIGTVWAQKKEWKKARFEFDTALELATDDRSRAAIWAEIGKNNRSQRNLSRSFAAFQISLTIREKENPKSLIVASTLRELGGVALALRNPDGAIKHFQHALAIQSRRAPGSLEEASTLNYLGFGEQQRSNLDESTKLLRRALMIQAQLNPDGRAVATTLNLLGIVAKMRGDYSDAVRSLQRSLAIYERLDSRRRSTFSVLNNLGLLEVDHGNLDQAVEYFRRALAIVEQDFPESFPLASVLANLEFVEYRRGNRGQAAKYLSRALEIRKRLNPNSLEMASSLRRSGETAEDRGDLDEALEYYQAAKAIQELVAPRSRDLATSLNRLGLIAHQRNDLNGATEYFQQALEIQESWAHGSLRKANTLENLGLVLRQANLREKSLESYLRSLNLLESTDVALHGTERIRADFRASHHSKFRSAIELLLELNHPEEALEVLESSRARSFLALLSERDLRFYKDLPSNLAETRRHLTLLHGRTLRRMYQLNSKEDQSKVEELLKQMKDIQRGYQENREKIRRASPQLAALQDPEPLDLQGIQNSLDPGTLLLSFSVGKEQIDIFAVSQERGLRVKTIALGETQLRDKVESFLSLIRATRKPEKAVDRAKLAPLQALGKYLYEILIAPLEDTVAGSDRLLILPDGPLHRLPFGALIRPLEGGDRGKTRDWQYLIEWKPIHVTLSATVYAELKKSRSSDDDDAGDTAIPVAAFGDPAYPSLSTELQESDFLETARARSAFRGCGFKHEALPHTKREVEEITKLYPKAKPYLGLDATEEAAKAVTSNTEILHLAAHGCIDDRFPLNSAVVLSLPEGFPEGRDNGLLQVWEIFESMRLNANLVVLSACESGLGQELRGEGLIGLTRAFQYAGARTVAASLWKVDDQLTAELMVRFYRHLKTGKPKDEALRAAQMELIQKPVSTTGLDGRTIKTDASSPYYWAAFQLYGDWL